jgi:hypothetical protein
MSRTLLEEAWAHLDDLVDKIMDPDTDADEKRDLQNQAKGVSQVLATFMPPHFEFPHEISAEAKVRWKARQEGRTDYETKGLGSRRTEFSEGFRSEGNQSKPTRNARQTQPKQEKALTAADRDGIRNARAAGFSDEQLAGVYGVSAATIAKVG